MSLTIMMQDVTVNTGGGESVFLVVVFLGALIEIIKLIQKMKK